MAAVGLGAPRPCRSQAAASPQGGESMQWIAFDTGRVTGGGNDDVVRLHQAACGVREGAGVGCQQRARGVEVRRVVLEFPRGS